MESSSISIFIVNIEEIVRCILQFTRCKTVSKFTLSNITIS